MAPVPVESAPAIEPDASRESSGEIDEHRSSSSTRSKGPNTDADSSPLPDEDVPPLPSEEAPALEDGEAPPLPDEQLPEDDGWEPVWDQSASAFYFYNRLTHATQWENPRVPTGPDASAGGLGAYDRIGSTGAPGTTSGAPGTTSSSYGAPGTSSPPRRVHGGYNPAIHGDYDPNADYALEAAAEEQAAEDAAARAAGLDPTSQYAATGYFNRFTGRWQAAALNPEKFNDENKSKRQMSAFFDVDAAANNHDGRSLKAERQGKKLTKQEVKAFRDKRREKKEEKRRAWLRD
ncbi:uncharacterized protein BDZ99DRAFT_458106 [Mytilinidion resinicola]|uniref:WW domain-containing protein n=1 Tax=Mytilinidion resinicola TaxID=574789 RepID=A0A6A6Z5A9_9PEZI|nr:uncharacterized protein BDZ99DRAFT_458106 [Mytilinidion resinicola]KAF2816210.1 hypothetical protein BDZ99DRAFT_458106 [Mytilinidion resinicola]